MLDALDDSVVCDDVPVLEESEETTTPLAFVVWELEAPPLPLPEPWHPNSMNVVRILM